MKNQQKCKIKLRNYPKNVSKNKNKNKMRQRERESKR